MIPLIERQLYNSYKCGHDMNRITLMYNTNEKEAQRIISKYTEKCKDLELFMDKLRKFLEDNYSKYAIKIYNPLCRYITNHNICTTEDVITLIDNEIYIRGIGVKFKGILKEFLRIYEGT